MNIWIYIQIDRYIERYIYIYIDKIIKTFFDVNPVNYINPLEKKDDNKITINFNHLNHLISPIGRHSYIKHQIFLQ